MKRNIMKVVKEVEIEIQVSSTETQWIVEGLKDKIDYLRNELEEYYNRVENNTMQFKIQQDKMVYYTEELKKELEALIKTKY